MATTTRVKQWGFSDDTIFTLGDDAAIAASVLSMTAPVLELPWATHWDTEPGYDGDGDAVLAQNVTYKAKTGGADITMLDGELHMQAKMGLDLANWFTTIRSGATNPILALMTSSGLELEGTGANADFSKFLDNTFREWVCKAIDGTVSVLVVDASKEELYGVTDSAAAGTVTLKQTAAANPLTLGGGSGGTEDQPYLAYRRTGTCELKAANAYTIPYGTTALGRLILVADRLGGGTEPLDLRVQYKIDSGAWTALPADGDLSGETFTAGTSTVLWRLSNAGGIGMDNANDCRYVPSVYAVLLTYEQTVATMNAGGQLKDVLTNIKAALNADATLMAYEGWSGAHVTWLDACQPKLYHRCGCMVEWKETPEEDQSNAREAGLLVWGKDENHNVLVRVCMRPSRALEDMLIGDDQLLDLTEDVLTVLRCETLSDTVARVRVASRRPSLEVFESGGAEGEPEDVLLIVDVEVEVQGKLITAVRP